MSRFESLCRSLRDLGIFFLGIAAIIAAVDYFFIHPDPMRSMKKEMSEMTLEHYKQGMMQRDKK